MATRDSSAQLLSRLRQILTERFSQEELRTLCFELSADYDSLPGEGLAGKARELVALLKRHERIRDLIYIGRRMRPDIVWPGDTPRKERECQVPEESQRYLPYTLYRELCIKPTDEITRQCVESLAALLQTVQTYCADPILAEAQSSRQAQGKWIEATLLLADISGFTAMSEQLSARGKAGAEQITHITNKYFAEMVRVLHDNGGYLIKFGGDALLGMFVGAAQVTSRYAVQAALDMQRAMSKLAKLGASMGVRLHMKVGVHTGRVFTAHVGSSSQMEYWITGHDVNITAMAADSAEPRQVVATESTRRYLTAWKELYPLPSRSADQPPLYHLPMTSGYSRLEQRPVIREHVLPRRLNGLVDRLDVLSPYLPKGLLPRLVHSPHSRRVEGEHRMVAVLFINVTGLSDLANSLSTDQSNVLVETMQDYFGTMQVIIEAHGGTVNKTDLYSTGDKLLAIFGAPVAHEDDIDQAARAALAMQSALERINQRLAARLKVMPEPLRHRMGLSTGYVFSGNVGAQSRQEYTIMGGEVNLAARVMSAAKWGEIWVAGDVFTWLEQFGEFEPLGEMNLKGKPKPIPVYRLVAIGQVYRPKPDLVNRKEERQLLQDTLEQLLRGQGSIMSLIGEPGIGKSRLLDDLRSRPEAKEALWLTGHCREEQPTYHLWADVLRVYLNLDAAEDREAQLGALERRVEAMFGAEQVIEHCPFLAIVLGLPLPAEWKDQIEPLKTHLPERLAHEVAEFVRRLTTIQPVVLICEDLHAIDAGSAEILLGVMALVEYSPVLIGLTRRPSQTHALERIAGVLTNQFQAYHTELALKPLSVRDSVQLVRSIAGNTIPPDRQRRVWERSQGNPLFISEFARAADKTPGVEIPNRVQSIISSRLDALPMEQQEAIKAAAVLGTRFTLPELAYLLKESETNVRKALAGLRWMQLITSQGNRYEFSNPLVRDVVYDNLRRKKRQELHCYMGDYWAAQSNPGQAAQHYFAGELWAEALQHGEQAAQECAKTYTHQEAIRLYGLASKAAKKLKDKAALARLYNQLGAVYLQIGDYPLAVKANQQILKYLTRKSTQLLAKANCALGCAYGRWGKLKLALAALEQGLELVGAKQSLTRARLLTERGAVLYNGGRLDEAEQDGKAALEIAQALGAREEEADACNSLGAIYGTQGRFDLALESHQRSLGIRRGLGVTHDISQSLSNVGTALSLLGRPDEAEKHFREALQLQECMYDRYSQGITHHNLAWLHRDHQETREAEEEYLRAMALWIQVEHRRGIAFVYNDLGTLYLEQGRLDEAYENLPKAIRHYEDMEANTYLPESYIALAKTCLGLNKPQEALAAADKALDWAHKNHDRAQQILAYLALGLVHQTRVEREDAQLCAQMSLNLAQTHPPLPNSIKAANELLEELKQAQANL